MRAGAGRYEAEGRPWGAGKQRQALGFGQGGGRRLPLRQGARGSHHVQ